MVMRSYTKEEVVCLAKRLVAENYPPLCTCITPLFDFFIEQLVATYKSHVLFDHITVLPGTNVNLAFCTKSDDVLASLFIFRDLESGDYKLVIVEWDKDKPITVYTSSKATDGILAMAKTYIDLIKESKRVKEDCIQQYLQEAISVIFELLSTTLYSSNSTETDIFWYFGGSIYQNYNLLLTHTTLVDEIISYIDLFNNDIQLAHDLVLAVYNKAKTSQELYNFSITQDSNCLKLTLIK